MPHISESHYKQGLASYRAGHAIRDLILIADQAEAGLDTAIDALPSRSKGGSDENVAERDALLHERIALGPSLIAGFADGLIDDIRKLANSPSIQRRGASA